MRWFTGMAIELNPIAILESYVEDIKKKLVNMEKQLQDLKGQIGVINKKLETRKEELAENQWQQYQGAKPLKTELENILEADEAVIRMRERLEYYRTFVVCIESIMKELNSRHFAIRASIDYQKMQNGVN